MSRLPRHLQDGDEGHDEHHLGVQDLVELERHGGQRDPGRDRDGDDAAEPPAPPTSTTIRIRRNCRQPSSGETDAPTP